MPAFLKYYSKERARHPAALATPVTQDEAVAVCEFLTRAASRKQFVVGRHRVTGPVAISSIHTIRIDNKRKSWSWYRRFGEGGAEISLACNMANLKTACHEWAHHAVRDIYEKWFASLRNIALCQVPKYRAHDKHHRELVDWAIPLATEFLRAYKAKVNTKACRSCGVELRATGKRGRPSVFCSQTCKMLGGVK